MVQQLPKITQESSQMIIDVKDENGLSLKYTLGDRVPVAVLTTSASWDYRWSNGKGVNLKWHGKNTHGYSPLRRYDIGYTSSFV
jgi:hypothetical protein